MERVIGSAYRMSEKRLVVRGGGSRTVSIPVATRLKVERIQCVDLLGFRLVINRDGRRVIGENRRWSNRDKRMGLV